MKATIKLISILCITIISSVSYAACRDNVVLVHGNTDSPSDFNNTYNALLNAGYSSSQIYRPSWGSKTCAVCNNHSGWEETPVRNAISSALNASCTGKVDIIAHSMGATLAAQQVAKLGVGNSTEDFVAIAGAFRGLNSCGTYPFNVWNSTCGSQGLSKNSPFINWLDNQNFGQNRYSIYSWIDQIVCIGGCTVGGTHTSIAWGNDQSYTFSLGHFGLKDNTTSTQVNLVKD